jgi:oligoribonuclease NrnB/cAMP/cGMP phosphodiesterase (DHH superfamily)
MNLKDYVKKLIEKQKKEKVKINVLVHNDLDGTGCLYLINKVFKNAEVNFKKVSYSKLVEKFNELALDLEENNKELLIVCDLGLNKRILDKLNLKAVKGKLLWLDHHIWDKELKKKLSEYGEIVINKKTCATGIVFNYFKEFLNFSEFDKNLKEIICDFDLWKLKKKISWKLSLALINYNLERFRKEKLEKGILFDEELEKNYLKNLRKFENLVKKFEKDGEVLKTKRGKLLMAFSNKKNMIFISHLYEMLKNKYDGFILVGESGKISLRGKIQVNDIAQEFGGGGHLNAAGGLVNYSKLQKFLNKILFKLRIYPKKEEIKKRILKITEKENKK